ncbi:MAG: Processive diacylglycerol beta-glucosyltransferase [Verrucomicrobiae bacterium]|nr:Processive diacylglycerol beta-glucosyltransferase [Verrucomicrobiae bacterium]
MTRRILFLYLTKHSGHYAAAVAIEEAARASGVPVESRLLDSFSHANPVLSKVTLRAYLTALKAAPEIWEWMYDNPALKERTALIRELLSRGNSRKLQKILAEFRPDVVVCTQAFACGVLASWKAKTGSQQPALVGVLTDFVAHRYWAHEMVDLYIAPNDATKATLVAQGVNPERISVRGLPVHQRFLQPIDKAAVREWLGFKPGLPVILVMGGSLGLGPMKSVIRQLDRLPQPFYIVAITGQNEELKERLERRGGKLRHPTRILGFVENVQELMEVAELVVTKPGGITTAECLVKRLPMIIINPIPGQEAKNTEFLLARGVAVQAMTATHVAQFVDEFLRNPEKLRWMRAAAAEVGCPEAAAAAARDILRLAGHAPARAALAEIR